eukprot:scpid95598/ scgid8553/ 
MANSNSRTTSTARVGSLVDGVSCYAASLAQIPQLFGADYKDVLLLGYFTALVKLFNAQSESGDPSDCPIAEEVIDWLGYAAMVIIYVIRHFFVLPITPRHVFRRLVRCLIFAVFALCIHSQPISCSLPRPTHLPVNGTDCGPRDGAAASDYLRTLHYIQCAVVLTLAIIATELLRQEVLRRAPNCSETTPPCTTAVCTNNSNMDEARSDNEHGSRGNEPGHDSEAKSGSGVWQNTEAGTVQYSFVEKP